MSDIKDRVVFVPAYKKSGIFRVISARGYSENLCTKVKPDSLLKLLR